MKNPLKNHRLLSVLLSVFVSVFLVALIAYAATTIGTNISTDGTLSVTGATDLSTASTTSYISIGGNVGNDDDILYFDSREENLTWDDDPGKFNLSDDLDITGVATSSLAFWAGTGGTANNLDLTGGDLYVQNDAEIDGGLWVNSATTTDTLSIGGYASSTGDINTQSNLHVGGTVTIDGIATSSAHIYLPRIKFQQSVATSTAPDTGECFMPEDRFKCYNGANWICMGDVTCN